MTQPKRVMIDMDAMVADLATEWHNRWNAKHPERLVTVEKAKEWDLGKAIGDSRIYGILTEPGLYRALKPIPGSQRAVEEIGKMKNSEGKRAFQIFFLTASITAPHILADKAYWMKDHFPKITPKQLIFAYHKEVVAADVFMDDSPKNLTRIGQAQPNAKLITIDYPYNQGIEVPLALRAQGWQDFEGAWEQIVNYMQSIA